MTVDIQYVQMATSEAMSTFITKKLNAISKKYDWIIKANVFFRIENDPTGNGKICEIQISAPGPHLFARSNENHFEKAAVASLKDIEKQLRKRKGILQKH